MNGNACVLCLTVLLGLNSLGCGEAKPAAKPADMVPESVKIAKEQTIAPEPIVVPVPVVETVPAVETVPVVEPEPVAAKPSLPPADHRIWLPTTKGPLIVDVDLRIGTRPAAQAFEQWIDSVLVDIGGDEDGGPPWQNLIDIVGGDSDRFGQNRGTDSSEKMVHRFDINRNGKVEPDEAAKYIYQSSPATSAFRLLGTDAYRYANRDVSPLFQLIDAATDGVLDDDDRIAAATRLRSRLDSNGDGNITIAEVALAASIGGGSSMTGNSMLVGAWDRRKSHRRGDVAMDLDGFVDWSSLAYNVHPSSVTTAFGLDRRWMSELDGDDNGSINADEAERLKTIRADLRIEVLFPDPASSPIVAPEIRLVEASNHLADKIVPSSDLILADESFQLIFRAGSMPDINQAECWRWQVRGRAAEVPDAWLAWLDGDHDRVLSSRELSQVADRLPENASSDSIADTFVVHFGRGDPAFDEAMFSMPQDLGPGRSTASTVDDPRPSWAIAMDANRDGDISQTEFLGTLQQFGNWDTDGDLFIDATEIEANASR